MSTCHFRGKDHVAIAPVGLLNETHRATSVSSRIEVALTSSAALFLFASIDPGSISGRYRPTAKRRGERGTCGMWLACRAKLVTRCVAVFSKAHAGPGILSFVLQSESHQAALCCDDV